MNVHTIRSGQLGSRIGAWADGRLVRNLGWYGLAEIVVRLSRLVTTVLLARVLLPDQFGIAAIALTAYELIRVLTSTGVGQMIIRASVEQLAETCAAAQRVIRLVTAALILLHLAVGVGLAHWFQRPELFGMVAALGLAYLVMPFGDVRYFLILRDNRLKAIAGITAAQVIADNALTATLALAGFGAWAVVLPKLLTAPIWLIGVLRAQASVPTTAGQPALALSNVLAFSGPLLASEILAALRGQADKLLVGAFLGVEALGIYYFAFNAGVGLSLSLTTALGASLYPHLAEVAHNRNALLTRYDKAIRSGVAPIAAMIALQAVLAVLYVPLVFGERWRSAVPLVALLCLSALARPLYDASVQLLRASGRTRLELGGALVFTALQLAIFALALRFGLTSGVMALTLTSLLGHGLFALWARRRLAGDQERGIAIAGAAA